MTHPVHPAAIDRVPYVVVEVTLNEQPDLRMVSNLVNMEPSLITMDAPVTAGLRTHASGQRLPVFQLAD